MCLSDLTNTHSDTQVGPAGLIKTSLATTKMWFMEFGACPSKTNKISLGTHFVHGKAKYSFTLTLFLKTGIQETTK